MGSATVRPALGHLRAFKLGERLAPAVAGHLTAWLTEAEDAVAILDALDAEDAVTRALANTPADEATPSPEAGRILSALARTGETTGPFPEPMPVRYGRFRIVRKLGEGGMGIVYEVVDEELRRPAALKMMRPQLAANGAARQRFLREARAAAALRSDHVVTIYHVDEIDGTPFLAMEYLEGEPLSRWRAAHPGPLAPEMLLRLAREVLLGLSAAHAKGLVHRDVKPSNILVEQATGRVKLLDFGLVRVATTEGQFTSEGVVLGTPAYMAPEQAAGKSVDGRADLFSLGVVLYWLVTGESPFHKATTMATLSALATVNPPALTGVPPDLSAFVARLMARNPDDRPRDAATALAEVETLAERLKTVLGKPRGTGRRLLIAAGFVALTALLTGIILIIWDKTRGTVDIIDTDRKTKTTLDLGALKGVLPPVPAGPRTGLQVKDRFVLRVSTAGYADDSSETFQVVHEGDQGEVLELVPGKSRCRVHLDRLGNEDVWILIEKLERLPK